MTAVICTRRKLAADGKVHGATSAAWDQAPRCTRKARLLRSDGRVFCARCAAVEKRRLFTDHLTWSIYMPEARDYDMVVTPTVGGYWVHATIDGRVVSMQYSGRSKSAAMSAFQLMVDEVAS